MQTASVEKTCVKTYGKNESPGEKAARIFKYFQQFNKTYIKIKIPPQRVAAKTLYNEHKTAFDSVADIFAKYELNLTAYIRYFVLNAGHTEKDIDSLLVSKQSIRLYTDYLSIIEKRKNIYSSVMKTVKNLTDLCENEKLFSAVDCMRWLIFEKKLGQYVVGGVISKYFLAGIPKFNKIVPKLDYFSKEELSDLVTRYDMYNTDANEAFMYVKNTMLNPLKLLDTSLSAVS